ncbi:MAG: YicC family protein [Oscillospiraceae bacterium]|nr:YicC family protein [Oscillospiraceae bacterium]MDE6658001.1 YicC family protein [Oscillospiraceae bacterium]
MLRSMTGYGRAQAQIDGRDILIEIKSVNARYLEQNVRINRNYSYLEEDLKSLVKTKTARGKLEIIVSITLLEGKKADIHVNEEIVKGYLDAMYKFNQTHNQLLAMDNDAIYDEGRLCWSSMLQLPDIFRVEKAEYDEEELKQDVLTVAEQALDAFITMRETEGEKLAEDVQSHLQYISEQVAIIEQEAPNLTEKYRERLSTKLLELLGNTGIDEQRILTEAAIFSEKTAVDEETVRLRSHLSQMQALLKTNNSIGRKLDFIVQEMNREVNTIGSKIQDVNITTIVVEIKSEIEKIREQIQNIE